MRLHDLSIELGLVIVLSILHLQLVFAFNFSVQIILMFDDSSPFIVDQLFLIYGQWTKGFEPSVGTSGHLFHFTQLSLSVIGLEACWAFAIS